MRGKSTIKLVVILAITVALGLGAFFGFSFWTSKEVDGKTVWNETVVIPGIKGIKKGLDVAGGVRLIYTIDGEDTAGNGIQKTENILRKRLDSKGLTEATVTIDTINPDNQMIIVEIPGFDDPEEASNFLGKTAKLQFIEPNGNIVMEGEDIVDATVQYGQIDATSGNQYFIQLSLSETAVKKFAEATGRVAQSQEGQNIIYIILDEEILSAPLVSEKIETANPIITGRYTYDEAKEQADLISSGALPFTLVLESQEYVGPTIGQKAFDITVNAGIIAFILIILFLICIYRIPGLVSALALTIYTVIFILICEWGGVIITLPGIAGIILSIAMAVDASVITYERLREELTVGKTLKTAVDLAFSKAFSTVRDSSVTTMISALVLFVLGTGSIQGFAISLMIGLVLSFLMAIFLLKFLIKNVTNVIHTKNYWFYGVKKTLDK